MEMRPKEEQGQHKAQQQTKDSTEMRLKAEQGEHKVEEEAKKVEEKKVEEVAEVAAGVVSKELLEGEAMMSLEMVETIELHGTE
jgi:hypothetical protein